MQCSNVLIRMHVHSPNYIISKMFLDGEGDVNSIDNQTVKTQGPDVILFFFRKIYPPTHFSSREIFITKIKPQNVRCL